MNVRNFAMGIGILYLVVGVLGFFPGLYQVPPPGAPDIAITAGYGYLFGLFPINVLHNFVHLAIGIWGMATARSFAAARGFARGLAWIYGVLTIMGLFPVLNTTFGLIPLFSHDIWLHALTAVVAAYVGYSGTAEVTRAAEQMRRAG